MVLWAQVTVTWMDRAPSRARVDRATAHSKGDFPFLWKHWHFFHLDRKGKSSLLRRLPGAVAFRVLQSPSPGQGFRHDCFGKESILYHGQ
jgi:hypothetical protein